MTLVGVLATLALLAAPLVMAVTALTKAGLL